MQVAIRADSSARMGSGHAVRCLTLAGELRKRGADVVFLARTLQGDLTERIEGEGYRIIRLPAPPATGDPTDGPWLGVSQEEDARQCLQILQGTRLDWLVVDHYGLDHDWERRLRAVSRRVLAIDDLANRRHDCDVLLDQNYFGAATANRYAGLVDPSCVQLLGPQFALLQPDYRRLKRLLPPRDGVVNRVLVFFGGSDLPNDTMRVLEALSCPQLAHLTVDVVVGQNHPDRKGVHDWVSRRRGAALHSGLPGLAGLNARADLAIGGGGSATWERACLSLPALVVSLAENQVGFSAALAADGYQVLLGRNTDVSVEAWRTALLDWIGNPPALAQMSRRVGTLVDGTGTERLGKLLLEAPADKARRRPVGATGRIADNGLRINLLSDSDSWLNDYLADAVEQWREQGHLVMWVHEPAQLSAGDVCFIVGCSQLLRPGDLDGNRYNLVVHESALPQGRGWSPMTWQVLEDRRSITVSLFEAAAAVDSGPIHLQTAIELTGRELVNEWRRLQARATMTLCRRWIAEYPEVGRSARAQSGVPSYYPRRGPADSRLDPERSIASQFDLLRTVDNERYPAHFQYRGRNYRVLIEADAEVPGDSSVEGS